MVVGEVILVDVEVSFSCVVEPVGADDEVELSDNEMVDEKLQHEINKTKKENRVNFILILM